VPATLIRKNQVADSLPIWSCSVCGLPCPPHYCGGGALLPHLFTLTRIREDAVWLVPHGVIIFRLVGEAITLTENCPTAVRVKKCYGDFVNSCGVYRGIIRKAFSLSQYCSN
jgi:hypothetical protein